MKYRRYAPLLAGLLMSAPMAASAHALVGSTPAEGATVAGLKLITLSFSEPLDPKRSSASLVMTAMPGMPDHPEMRMSAMKMAFGDGGRTISLRSARPLAAGSYRVDWSSANDAGRRMTGHIAFMAK